MTLGDVFNIVADAARFTITVDVIVVVGFAAAFVYGFIRGLE